MLDSSLVLSVVIPCRNEESYIAACLDSIAVCDFPKENLKVFVCDGLSDDKTVEIVKEYAFKYEWIELLVNEKQTTPFALNLGIKSSKSEYVTILGAHAEVGRDYFTKCVSDFLKDEAIACTGGLLENVYDDEISEAIGYAQSHWFGVGNAHFRTGLKSGFVDTVAFGTYKRAVFEEIEYFDEELARNQDDEFNYRLIKSGYKIWLNTSAKTSYFVRGSINKLWKQYFQYGYWKVFVNKKHKAVTTVRQLVPAVFVLCVLGMFVFTKISPPLSMLCFLAVGCYFFISFILGILFLVRISGGSMKKARTNMLAPLLIMVSFFTLHFSYGLGYLKGIWNFLILRKTPSKNSHTLSR